MYVIFVQARESEAKIILSMKVFSFILTPREAYNFMAIFLAFYIKKTHWKGKKQKQLKLCRIDEAKIVDESSR